MVTDGDGGGCGVTDGDGGGCGVTSWISAAGTNLYDDTCVCVSDCDVDVDD